MQKTPFGTQGPNRALLKCHQRDCMAPSHGNDLERSSRRTPKGGGVDMRKPSRIAGERNKACYILSDERYSPNGEACMLVIPQHTLKQPSALDGTSGGELVAVPAFAAPRASFRRLPFGRTHIGPRGRANSLAGDEP